MSWREVEEWYVEACPSRENCSDKAWARASISSDESEYACRQSLLDHLMKSSLHWEERDRIGADGMRDLADLTEVKSHKKMVKIEPSEKRSRPSSNDSPADATRSIAVPTRVPSHGSAGMVTIPRADLEAIHATLEASSNAMSQMSKYFKAGSLAFDVEVSKNDSVMTKIKAQLENDDSNASSSRY